VQTVPQAPQLFLSVARVTQVPAQLVSPVPQAVPQCPETQTWPGAQAVVQLPQCAGSIAVLMQELPQVVRPVGHTHTPLLQFMPAGQAVGVVRVLQAPQLPSSLARFVQMPEQLVRPA
jgi:hypothetical protein